MNEYMQFQRFSPVFTVGGGLEFRAEISKCEDDGWNFGLRVLTGRPSKIGVSAEFINTETDKVESGKGVDRRKSEPKKKYTKLSLPLAAFFCSAPTMIIFIYAMLCYAMLHLRSASFFAT